MTPNIKSFLKIIMILNVISLNTFVFTVESSQFCGSTAVMRIMSQNFKKENF